MSVKPIEMKRHRIVEWGRGVKVSLRAYIVEIPETVDPKSLDGPTLSEAADEAKIKWEKVVYTETEHTIFDLAHKADDDDVTEGPVIRVDITKEGNRHVASYSAVASRADESPVA